MCPQSLTGDDDCVVHWRHWTILSIFACVDEVVVVSGRRPVGACSPLYDLPAAVSLHGRAPHYKLLVKRNWICLFPLAVRMLR